MAYKYGKDLREDYPDAKVKGDTVYDSHGDRIGYVCGDGDIRIKDELYHMK